MEAVLGKRNFAAAVALMHAANLRHGHMALVDDAKEVIGEVIEQRIRRLARLSAVKVTRVVLDSAAEPHGLEHFEVVVHAHLKTLRLEQLAFFFELRQTVAQLFLNALDGAVHLGASGHIMRSRPDGKRLVFVQDLARHVVYLLDALDLVPQNSMRTGLSA